MQAISPTLTKKLNESPDIGVRTRVVAEFNHNRLSMPTVTNTAVEEYDEEMFPLDSITASDRPTAGIVYASEDDLGSYPGASMAINEIDFDGVGPRFLVSDPDAKYKYWISPTKSTSTGTISNVIPTVKYDTVRKTNKIYLCFENTIVQPVTYTISVSKDGTTYTTAASNIVPSSRGIVELWLQDNGTWSTTRNLNNVTDLRGLRVTVTKINLPSQRVSIIEQSLRLETDLSDYVKSWSADAGMGDTSQVTPIGRASGGGGDVTLSNANLLFSNRSPSSPYNGLLDKGTIFKIDTGFNIGTWAAPVWEYVRSATLRSEIWTGQDRATTSVKLQDDSAILQTLNPPAMAIEGMSVGKIVGMLLDSVGYTNYSIDQTTTDSSVIIPFYSTDGEKNVWELMSDLSQVTQTAFFFDEWGVLRIRAMTAAYNTNNTVPIYLRGTNSGTNLANIKSFEFSGDYEANVVDVKYVKTTEGKKSYTGVPTMEVVWEAEDDVVLRGSFLTRTLTTTDTMMVIANPATWPMTGTVQIEGEFIKYDAKEYRWYDNNGVRHWAWVSNEDQKQSYDARNTAKPHLANDWSGGFRISERGAYGTLRKAHYVDTNSYEGIIANIDYSRPARTWKTGIVKTAGMSWADLRTNNTFKWWHTYRMTKGTNSDVLPTRVGTRIRFNSLTGVGGAGITFGKYGGNAYYIELIPTATVDAQKLRNTTNELRFYVSNASKKKLKAIGKGVALPIVKGLWYDIDVNRHYSGSTAVFTVYVNGVQRAIFNVPSADRFPDDTTGRYGLFTRGYGSTSYEYLYAQTGSILEASDGDRVWDRISGGFVTDQSLSEWMGSLKTLYRIVNKKKEAYTQRYTSFFFDDFAAVVHEVREFDVKFEKHPAQFSRLFFTNEQGVVCPWYDGDSHSARFMLINTSRQNAVVNGEDTLTFGVDNAVTQKLAIYGRTLKVDEPRTHTVRNERAIRRRGENQVDIESPLIQSEAAAKQIGKFITDHWGDAGEEVDTTVWGVPHAQIGDIVTVDHPSIGVSSAKYYVVSVDREYSSTPSFKLKLRKVK